MFITNYFDGNCFICDFQDSISSNVILTVKKGEDRDDMNWLIVVSFVIYYFSYFHSSQFEFHLLRKLGKYNHYNQPLSIH